MIVSVSAEAAEELIQAARHYADEADAAQVRSALFDNALGRLLVHRPVLPQRSHDPLHRPL